MTDTCHQVYLFNEAFPLVFGPTGHGFSTGEWGLTFLGLLIGSLVGALLHPLQERVYLRRVAQNDGKGVPEARMWMARGGAFLLPISLFWFGWTSYASVPWIVPVIASAFFGLGIYIVILSILNYVVDSYVCNRRFLLSISSHASSQYKHHPHKSPMRQASNKLL